MEEAGVETRARRTVGKSLGPALQRLQSAPHSLPRSLAHVRARNTKINLWPCPCILHVLTTAGLATALPALISIREHSTDWLPERLNWHLESTPSLSPGPGCSNHRVDHVVVACVMYPEDGCLVWQDRAPWAKPSDGTCCGTIRGSVLGWNCVPLRSM